MPEAHPETSITTDLICVLTALQTKVENTKESQGSHKHFFPEPLGYFIISVILMKHCNASVRNPLGSKHSIPPASD